MPESGGRETWGPRKLTAPSHGHPFPLSMGSNWQFTGLPGSGPSSLSYLGHLGGGGQGAGGGAHGRKRPGLSSLLGRHLRGSLGNRHGPLTPWLGGPLAPRLSLTDRAPPCLLKDLEGQSGGESGKEFLSRKNLGRAGPKVPTGLLNQAGDRQCSLSEPRGRGRPAVTQTTCGSHRHGHARVRGACGGGVPAA